MTKAKSFDEWKSAFSGGGLKRKISSFLAHFKVDSVFSTDNERLQKILSRSRDSTLINFIWLSTFTILLEGIVVVAVADFVVGCINRWESNSFALISNARAKYSKRRVCRFNFGWRGDIKIYRRRNFSRSLRVGGRIETHARLSKQIPEINHGESQYYEVWGWNNIIWGSWKDASGSFNSVINLKAS